MSGRQWEVLHKGQDRSDLVRSYLADQTGFRPLSERQTAKSLFSTVVGDHTGIPGAECFALLQCIFLDCPFARDAAN